MATIPKSYKKNIAEGNGIFIFSILFALVIRLVYFFSFDNTTDTTSDGYLVPVFEILFQSDWVSFVCSSLFVAGIAVLAAHINTEYVLIRRKTMLVPSVVILLFSCHPLLVQMSLAYVGVAIFFAIIAIFFESYNALNKQVYAFKATFMLALGSIFTPVLLLYLPALWIGFAFMRGFSFKALLATFLGLFIVYFPAFTYYFLTDNIDIYIKPFSSISLQRLSDFFFLEFSVTQWIVLSFSMFLLIVIITDNYINRHKDKIRIREYLNLLSFISVFALLLSLFVNIDSLVNIYIVLGTGALLLSHFFSLAEKKNTAVLFYFCLIMYLFICFLPFFDL